MIKRIALASLLTALLSTPAIAWTENSNSTSDNNPNTTTLSMDMTALHITQHEIALMDVLSEICPPMLSEQDHTNFYNAYNMLLGELLPSIDDPQAAMQYLSTQQDYQQILNSVRTWTMQFYPSENKALCEEMAGKIV